MKGELVSVEAYRHPKFGDRLALRYAYDPDTNGFLKSNLGFPKHMWDSDKRAWSIQSYSSVIAEACTLLQRLGYDTSAMSAYADMNDIPATDCWVKTKRTHLYLHFPYSAEVVEVVRGISGRKWHANQRCWSIPTTQAWTLHNAVEQLYPPLAEAIASCDDVRQAVEETIERVAISSAATLTREGVEAIDTKLAGKFPPGLDLYPFQKVAVAFAELSNGRCLIGDEMGIGKTISAIGYAALHPDARPAVVVCPSNVKFNWKKELNKWLPSESVHVIEPRGAIKAQQVKDFAREQGASEEQCKTRASAEAYLKARDLDFATHIPTADFVLVNYDMMSKYEDSLVGIAPRLVILDESHYIKNSGSPDKPVQRTVSTLRVARSSPKVLALSGTAISNRPREFFNTLNLMRPDQFNSEWDFLQRYCDPYHDGWGWDFSGASNTQELNERTRDLCIRRLKSEVLPELPPKTRTFIPIKLKPEDRRPYDILQEEWDAFINKCYFNGEPLPPGSALQMLNELRHECGRIKVDYAADWIQLYREQTGKPIVVFTHHRDVLNNLYEKVSRTLGTFQCRTISGDTPSQLRQLAVDHFQAGSVKVLICNTMAAKEGITLTAADTVLFLEREWTPTDEEQAEDRVYRIGQESQHVHAIYLSCVGTVDEHFDRVVEEKREVVKAVLDGGDVQKRKGLVSQLVKRLKEERGWKMK